MRITQAKVTIVGALLKAEFTVDGVEYLYKRAGSKSSLESNGVLMQDYSVVNLLMMHIVGGE